MISKTHDGGGCMAPEFIFQIIIAFVGGEDERMWIVCLHLTGNQSLSFELPTCRPKIIPLDALLQILTLAQTTESGFTMTPLILEGSNAFSCAALTQLGAHLPLNASIVVACLCVWSAFWVNKFVLNLCTWNVQRAPVLRTVCASASFNKCTDFREFTA